MPLLSIFSLCFGLFCPYCLFCLPFRLCKPVYLDHFIYVVQCPCCLSISFVYSVLKVYQVHPFYQKYLFVLCLSYRSSPVFTFVHFLTLSSYLVSLRVLLLSVSERIIVIIDLNSKLPSIH